MTKENFDKMLVIDGWMHREGSVSPDAEYTYMSTYIPPYDKYNKYTILGVFVYPDRYDISVRYKSGDSLDLSFKTENEAYDMLYRFIYNSESIRYIEKFEFWEKKVSEEEFVSQKENPFVKMASQKMKVTKENFDKTLFKPDPELDADHFLEYYTDCFLEYAKNQDEPIDVLARKELEYIEKGIRVNNEDKNWQKFSAATKEVRRGILLDIIGKSEKKRTLNPIEVEGYKDITTTDEIKEIIAKYEAIKERMEDFLREVEDINYIEFLNENHMYHHIAYELGCDLTIGGTSGTGGNIYSESEDIKSEWLLLNSDAAAEEYYKFRQEKEERKKAEREAEKQEKLAKEEAKEREEYERLKAKFENKSNLY